MHMCSLYSFKKCNKIQRVNVASFFLFCIMYVTWSVGPAKGEERGIANTCKMSPDICFVFIMKSCFSLRLVWNVLNTLILNAQNDLNHSYHVSFAFSQFQLKWTKLYCALFFQTWIFPLMIHGKSECLLVFFHHSLCHSRKTSLPVVVMMLAWVETDILCISRHFYLCLF